MPKYCARGQSYHQETPCVDVCTSPLCGTPDLLPLYAPLIYDEIGINVCRTITVTNTAFATQTTAEKATVQVLDVTFGNSTVTTIARTSQLYRDHSAESDGYSSDQAL